MKLSLMRSSNFGVTVLLCLAAVSEVASQSCDSSQFQCVATGDCVSLQLRCNNVSDCSDGSDELDCEGCIGENCLEMISPCLTNPCENNGSCTVSMDGTNFICSCPFGFTSDTCSANIDDCIGDPCLNGANCTDMVNGFMCDCLAGFSGRQCHINNNECSNDPCVNGTCIDLIADYTCECDFGFTGRNCSINIDNCVAGVCLNNGTCIDDIESFFCDCPEGFGGPRCEITSACEPQDDNCQNSGLCTISDSLQELCQCTDGFTGSSCEIEIDECSSSPCDSSSTCVDQINDYTCVCGPGYTGRNCTEDINECELEPCQNDAVCMNSLGSFTCFCSNGFTEPDCSVNIDDCADVDCMNGATCIDGIDSFMCMCPTGFDGDLCEINLDDCIGNPCINNGTCVDGTNNYTCMCSPGYIGENCSIPLSDCDQDPCMNNATCVNDPIPGLYSCLCPGGFTGSHCEVDINDCMPSPCLNGATCVDGIDQYDCICADGYSGENCSVNIDDCLPQPCMNNGTCNDLLNDFMCECVAGYTGDTCMTNIDDCNPNPCENNGTCVDLVDQYMCECVAGFTDVNCTTNIDDCALDPCENNGTCFDLVDDFSCQCLPGYTGITCTVNIDDCNPNPCENNGTCNDLIAGFTCECITGYTGDTCMTNIDDCNPNPCENNGTCNDLKGDFTCNCIHGYTGDTCATNIDECDPNPCSNNGTCIDMVDGFLCLCIPGYSGETCTTDIDDCNPNPCENNGTCTDLVDDFSCQCLPGYTGNSCTINIDDCVLNPCENNGTCNDLIDGFTCNCITGYTGDTCMTNIDDCNPNPCENNATCVDLVNGLICECVAGFTDVNCTTNIDECTLDPCENNGTCIDLVDDFSCQCLPGYTGITCTVNINDCYPNPCKNNGTCIDLVNQYMCECVAGFTDENCTVDINECDSNPCVNNGTCVDCINNYMCLCLAGYNGTNCQLNIDDCQPNPCLNDGICMDGISSYTCMCPSSRTGVNCETALVVGACQFSPCENNSTCIDGEADNQYQCHCSLGYTGTNCSEDIDITVPSFSGRSYLVFELPTDILDVTDVDIVIRPNASEGIIFYSSQMMSMPYISITLEGGIPVLRYDLGSGIAEIISDYRIDNDQWHLISIRRNEQYSELTIDNDATYVGTSPGNQSTLILRGLIYIGGVGASLTEVSGFVGCIREVQVNNVTFDLLEDNIEAANIGQCNTPACSYVQCLNGGTCVDLAIFSYVCQCPEGFVGQNCDISNYTCSPNTCMFGGICLALGNDYICQCPLGRAGRTCEESINITTPLFGGNSYITFSPITNASVNLTISLYIKPTADDGLILFNSFSNVDFSEYIYLFIVNGFVEFGYDNGIGSEPVMIRSDVRLQLDEWHYIEVSKYGHMGSLIVNDHQPVFGQSLGTLMSLSLSGNLWVGGIDDVTDISSVTDTSSGFKGCIDQLTINSKAIDLILDSEMGYGIRQCNTSLCQPNLCLNGGRCQDGGSNFFCNCQFPFTGPLCAASTINPCDNPLLCASGATCVTAANGVDYSCICPVGATGERCSQIINIQDPFFNVTSHLRYRQLTDITSTTTIRVTFFPIQSAGVILYAGDVTRSTDFIALTLSNSRVEFRYNLGSGLARIVSNPVNLYEWHTAEATRSLQSGTLIIDYTEFFNGTSPGTTRQLNIIGFLYLGGIDTFSIISKSIGINAGFAGCIDELMVNEMNYSLINDSLSGGNIRECRIDACDSSPCLNDGVCSSVGETFQCHCRFGFEGPTCSNMIRINIPFFNGNSFITYTSFNKSIETTRIYLELRPNTLDGLMLYNGQINGTDYILLSLSSGFVQFQYDLGSGPAVIESRHKLDLYEWHTIEAWRTGQSGVLIVNGIVSRGTSPGTDNLLELGELLFLGGIPDIISVSRNISETGYTGCIRNLQISPTNELINFIADSLDGQNITKCPSMNVCANQPCINGGTCVQEMNERFTCLCPDRYTGIVCEDLVCSVNPCENGGRCIAEMVNGTEKRNCLCSVPYGGEFCTEVTTFTHAQFEGDGYLQLSTTILTSEQSLTFGTSIFISFISTSNNGLLFYAGPPVGVNGNYISIGLNNGTVEYQFDLGSGVVLIRSEFIANINTVHIVNALRMGQVGQLSVDNRPSVEGTSPGQATQLNFYSTSVFYLGGSPDVELSSRGSYTSGHSGCLGDVTVGTNSTTATFIPLIPVSGVEVTRCGS